jgi:DNA-directed RNA polymerase subunit F
MDLKKSVFHAAQITFMQQKAIDFLKESAAKEGAEALKVTSALVSILRVMKMTTVLTTVETLSMQSPQ